MRTHFFGLGVSIVFQFAEERVLLGQQHFNVLHTHFDYPGANIWLKSVDTLVGETKKLCLANPGQNMTNPDSSQLDGACECMR